jgi:signal transduction histidine kinase
MKLWQKVSLICCIVLIGIVTVCGMLLILQSKSSILELTYKQARDKQSNLASSFSEMAGYYSADNDLPATTSALIKYCFTRFADATSVLQKDHEILYSEIAIAPGDYLPIADATSEQQQFTGEIDGRNILIVGSRVTVKGDPYFVFVVEDITSVYSDILYMIWRFALIGVAAIILGTGLIVFLIRCAMHPLARLRETTKQIADGAFGKRADVVARDEVGALAADFNTMADAVETHIAELTETAERQRLFIGGVTHEYKTPLTTMLLHTDLLQNAYLEEDEKQISLSHVQSQCKWLERLTQKLLKLITLQGQLEMKRESVANLFCRVQSSMDETLKIRKTPLFVECGIDTLIMDIDLMQSLFVNLVDNASKSSEPGQGITLRAYDHTIEVRDHGYGIPEGELERITEPFYMVDRSRSKKKGGSGLGLALVKEIATAHGAKISIESKLNEGTAVRITFPR